MLVEKKTPVIMGQVNKANVLHFIKEQGPTSRANVAKTLNMSRSTISSIVDTLIREGRIREGSAGESTAMGGRKPITLHYVSTAKYALGVDIGSSKTIAMVTDLEGKVIYREKFPTSVDGQPVMPYIRAELERVLLASGVASHNILGTGIGFPGVTVASEGRVVDAPGFYLHEFKADEFFRDLPSPLLIDNDVNMAVIGERWKGAAKGSNNVVLVAIGSGIGAGFILDGRIYRGSRGFAGEMGHLHVNPFTQDKKRNLADYGPLEQVASGKGIEDAVFARLPKYPESMLHSVAITAQNVFQAAEMGDVLAVEVIDEAISYLAFSIANMVTLFNPDVVIVGGGVSRIGDPLIERIREGIARLSPMTCDIIAAGLGEDAAAFGSAATVLMRAGELRMHGFDDWSVIAEVSEI